MAHELPEIVTRAPTAAEPPARRRLRILYVGDAALARECLGRPGGSIDLVAADPRADGTIDYAVRDDRSGTSRAFDLLFIEQPCPGVETVAILEDLAARNLNLPVVIVADWDEDLAVRALELGASDYVLKSRASFRAVYFRLHRLIAHSALLDERARLRVAQSAAIDVGRATEEDVARRVAEGEAARETAEHQLNDVVSALKLARQERLADAVAAARELAQRESGFAARLAAAGGEAEQLRQQFAETDAALRRAEERATVRQRALSEVFARRHADLEAALSSEVALRHTLETKLASAAASFQAAEAQRRAEVAASADTIAQLQAEFLASIAQITRARDTFERGFQDATVALDRAHQDRERDAAAAAQQLAEREAALLTELASAAQIQAQLERRAVDVETALRCAEQRVTAEQHAAQQLATEREAEFQAECNRLTATREALRQQLADATRAVQCTEELRAADLADAETRFNDARIRYDELLSAAASVQDGLREQLARADARHQDIVERHVSEMNDAVARLARSQETADARLAQAAAATTQVEGKLADAVAALAHLEHEAAAELQAARAEAVLQRSAFEAELSRERANRQAVEVTLAESKAERERSAQEYASAIGHAEQRLADHQQRTETWLTEAAAVADSLDARLAAAMAALDRAQQQASLDRQTAIENAVRRQAEFDARLGDERSTREVREAQLRALEIALQHAHEQHASELAEAAQRLADHQQQADDWLTDAAAVADSLDARLAAAMAALDRAQQQAVLDHQTAIENAVGRQAEFDARLGDERSTREAREAQLQELEIALQRAREQHASDLAEAAQRLADHRQQADVWLTDAAAVADSLEASLAGARAAVERTAQQAALDGQAAREDASRRQAEFDARLADEVAVREAREGQLREAESALERTEQQHVAEMAAAAAELASFRAEAEARMSQIAARAAAELEAVERQAAAAAEEAAAHQRAVEVELAREVAEREALAQALAASEGARQRADEHHSSEMAAAAAEIATYQADAAERTAQLSEVREYGLGLEKRAAEERADWERIHLDAQERIRHLQTRVEHVGQSLVEASARIEQQEKAYENDLASRQAAYAALQDALDRTRATADETMARVSNERALERATLEALVADREMQLRGQAARQQESDEAAATALSEVEHRLQRAIDAHDLDRRTMAELENKLAAAGQQLEALRQDRNGLRIKADRVSDLQNQINDIQTESRRQFDAMPVSVCRCSRDGAVTQVNHALATLLGYSTPDDVVKLDFADAVFDSGDELPWLVDRCLASRTTQSIETAWRRRDGSRIIVRVQAVAATADAIDLVAEDITRVRVLEEKLRNSQRMEAVARYGSEVAVTCHTLLRHVKQEGQQWLARMESDATRYQGELLLDEVTRAAGFLGQFAAYGNEQKNVPELVDVNKLLRDLGPVLKRVAGDNIEFVLPQPETPLNLDVDAKRVERMLVNVAAYGRQRMPLGGRLMIEVAGVVVDREFVTKYPNVRPGPHVLLTVTELRGAGRPDVRELVRIQTAEASAAAPFADTPGVDLGTLQALVSDCDGHLWMMAEPSGNMVLKIHLPRRVLDRSEPAMRPVRSRWIHRAFGARH